MDVLIVGCDEWMRLSLLDTLTEEERQALEALVRSTKSEVRQRFRARIVLLAGAGTATREISRRLRCTIGTASKWRVGMRVTAWPVCRRSATAARRGSMTRPTRGASWHCSTSRRRRNMRTGAAR